MHRQMKDVRLAVIGLGYVGLPLLIEFAKKFPATGYDIHQQRIDELTRGLDVTNEMTPEELMAATNARYSSDLAALRDANVYIVTVPTPIDQQKRPDFGPLEKASTAVGGVLKQGDVVIYESTVYPGATEEVCVPILEKVSGLRFNKDFFVGYSPERINSGDKLHRLPTIVKVTSGSTPETAEFVDALYRQIISAGTHKASSLKVAEAAKVIENTQRDLNIALINELCIIFEKIGIDTEEVLKAAGTKWNFLNFRPGLVGGHCISVDPYYLTHKAQQIGYHPDVILAGRKINDNMGYYIAERVIKLLTRKRIHVVDSRILVLGFAFKENCPDLRNTRVIDVVAGLQEFNARVDIHDPWVSPAEARHEYGIDLVKDIVPGTYDAVIVAVAHESFKQGGIAAVRSYCKPGGLIFDVKYILPQDAPDVERL